MGACIYAAAVIDASIVRLIHVSPAAVDAAKSIKESTDFKCKTDAGHKICNQIVCLSLCERVSGMEIVTKRDRESERE